MSAPGQLRKLMWFRSDLRVHDNPALNAACDTGICCALYVIAEGQWDEHYVSASKRQFILGNLESLKQELSQRNIPMVILKVETFEDFPAVLADVCTKLSIDEVYYNAEYELNELRMTCAVKNFLARLGVSTYELDDQCLIKPGKVLTQTGQMFRVYSAFKKRFLAVIEQHLRPLAATPAAQNCGEFIEEINKLDVVGVPKGKSNFEFGEQSAHNQLNAFIDGAANDYSEDRDIPSVIGTSRLSPYLASGVLSTRQCLQAVLRVNDGHLTSGNPGINSWFNELIWRDFYRHIVFSFPEICKGKAFLSETDHLPWARDMALLEAWKSGRTGYPLVDAGMRELKQTGWMHNRVRMVTAMFFTKHLFLDWRLGERHFMETLIDADFCSNNGGWQWSASTGVDAAPYFRIFNPQRQSERFDSGGDYIRKYVPELASLDSKSIHCPNSAQRLKCGYPEPIVDHKTAVAKVKSVFASLSRRNEVNDANKPVSASTKQVQERTQAKTLSLF